MNQATKRVLGPCPGQGRAVRGQGKPRALRGNPRFVEGLQCRLANRATFFIFLGLQTTVKRQRASGSRSPSSVAKASRVFGAQSVVTLVHAFNPSQEPAGGSFLQVLSSVPMLIFRRRQLVNGTAKVLASQHLADRSMLLASDRLGVGHPVESNAIVWLPWANDDARPFNKMPRSVAN